MGKFRPIDTFRHELTSALVEQLHEARSPVEHEVIKSVVRRITNGWTVTVHHSASPEDSDVMGYNLGLCLPWRRESDEEAAARQARWEAMMWDSEAGPPPPGVSMSQLLRQDIWWQMRDAPPWEGGKLVPVRIEDMDHNHRLNLLEWLRTRSEQLHSSLAGELLGAPDDVWASYEAEDPYEWIEEQELIQALVRWTTPYAESPLTWRPMAEAPKDGTVIVVRWADAGPLDMSDRIYWSRGGHGWYFGDGGSSQIYEDEFSGWRELRDDEKPSLPLSLTCNHAGYDESNCGDCGALFYPCSHGGSYGSDECSWCEQE
jgi:hypothetical protein